MSSTTTLSVGTSAATAAIDLGTHRRMNDRVEVAQRCRIGEHDVGQLGPDQSSFGVEHAFAEPIGDRLDDR